MNFDPIIDHLLEAYRKKTSDTIVDNKCQDLIDTLRDPARMRELVAQADARPAISFTPRKFGEFELTGWIGAGGMGQVYRAVHPELGREQALKMLPPERVTNAQAMSRFKREIRAVGQLNHPSIVTVYDAGQVDGTPYLTMELIDGQSLSEVVRDARREGGNIEVATACRLIADAAEGIQHAHENGVLHRDIKPGNLMLDSQGRVRILDLGLAKFVDVPNATETDSVTIDAADKTPPPLTDEQLTAAQQILGTPDYMAPEQISSANDVDVRTDVYSLAATLHYLLTGEVLFADKGSDLLRKAVAVLQTPAPLVSEKRDDVPEGLSDLIAAALSKDAGDRPQNAAEFAAILRPFATPAAAPEATPDAELRPQIASAWLSPPRRAALWLLALLPLGAALAGLLILLNSPDGSTLRIESDDPNVKVIATWVGETADGSLGSPMQFEATPNKPATLKAGHWIVSIDGDQRGQYELSQTKLTLKDGETRRLVVTRTLPKKIIEPIDPAPKSPQTPSSVVATTKPHPSDADLLKRLDEINWKPGAVQQFDGYASTPTDLPGIDPGRWQAITAYPHSAGDCVISPQGNYLAAWHHETSDPYTRIIERRTGRLVGMFKYSNRTSSRILTWSADESKLIAFERDGGAPVRASVFRRNGVLISRWANDFDASMLQWSPDGTRILLANSEAMQQRAPDGTLINSFKAPSHGFDTVGHLYKQMWSPDGSQFAGVLKNELYVYDADGGEPVAVIKADSFDRDGVIWHPSGEKVLTSDGRFWNLAGDHVQFKIDRLHERILAFSPDGRFFVTNHGDVRDLTDRVVSKLDVSEMGYIQGQDSRWATDNNITFFSPRTRGLGYSVDYSQSGKVVAKWDLPVPMPQHSFTWARGSDDLISLANPLHYQTTVAAKRIQWGIDPGEVAQAIELSQPTYGTVAFSPVSDHIACTSPKGIVLMNKSGEIGQQLDDTYSSQFLRSWSPDGKRLALGGGQAGHFVDVYEGTKKVCRLGTGESQLKGIQCSPDGQYLCVWDHGNSVFVWDIAKPSEIVAQRDAARFSSIDYSHWSSDYLCPSWSSDGSRLAIPTNDAVLLVSPKGDDDIELPWDKSAMGRIWWHPDGKKLIAGKVMIDVGTKQSEPIVGAERLMHFAYWLDQDRFVGADDTSVMIWDKATAEPNRLPLPKVRRQNRSIVTMPARGLNARWVSESGRYVALPMSVIYESGVATGDMVLVDLQEKKLLWTGIAFSDGNCIQMDPTGRVASTPRESGKYIQYMVGYGHERRVPLTPLQFASRIGLSPTHRRLQELIDVGGTVVADRPLNDQNQRDSRDLPDPKSVKELLLVDCPYELDDEAFSFEANFPELKKVDLSGSGVTLNALAFIQNAQSLQTLSISGAKIDNRLAAILPPNLQDLDVSNTEVGDFLLYDLKRLKSLRKLNLSRTIVTGEAIDKLSKQLPECNIVWDQKSKAE